jgi:putative FmdB family regulatory protein
MPIFEFICQACGEPFEELVRLSSQAAEIACPSCGSREVKKKISTFASRVAGGSSLSTGLSSASCTGSV